MFDTLANPVLPIFMALVVGYLLFKIGVLTTSDAVAINKIAFYMAVPALIVSVIGSAPIAGFEWPAIFVNLAVQLFMYAAVFALMYFGFKRDIRESILLGMSAVIVNHIFFVLPIAERIYGPSAGSPMAGIVMFDAGVIIPASVFVIALLTAGPQSFARMSGLIFKNPFFYAPPVGILLGILGDSAPAGIMTFAQFAGAAAAPVLLFALGITLAGSSLLKIGGAVWVVVGAKLLVVPLLVWMGLGVFTVSQFTNDITLLVAAGPCGAIPFVVATQYGVKTDTIAKAVLVSTILSIISLSVLTA